MSKLEIKKCVLEIIDSLCDRNGFDDWWYNLGDDIEKEITTELESIIERRLNKDEFNIDDIFTSHMVPPHLFGLKEKDDRTMDKPIDWCSIEFPRVKKLSGPVADTLPSVKPKQR